MNVWLDDIRPMPDNYDVWVKNAKDCIEILRTRSVTHISLDHDLGEGPDGASVARWMAEFDEWWGTWDVHSMNPVGRKRIQDTLPALRQESLDDGRNPDFHGLNKEETK